MASERIIISQEQLDDALVPFIEYIRSNPFASTHQLDRDLKHLRQSIHPQLSNRTFCNRMVGYIRSDAGQRLIKMLLGIAMSVDVITNGRELKYFLHDTPLMGNRLFTRTTDDIIDIVNTVLDYRSSTSKSTKSTKWTEISAVVSQTGYDHRSVDNIISAIDKNPELINDRINLATTIKYKG